MASCTVQLLVIHYHFSAQPFFNAFKSMNDLHIKICVPYSTFLKNVITLYMYNYIVIILRYLMYAQKCVES